MIEYTGQKIDASEARRRRFRQHLYIFRLNKKQAIDGAIGGGGAEFINHSCNANLITHVAVGKIFLTSLRPILCGEELTYDYNIHSGSNLSCSCGAKNCRGLINRQ